VESQWTLSQQFPAHALPIPQIFWGYWLKDEEIREKSPSLFI
jgi:hypothetical protein